MSPLEIGLLVALVVLVIVFTLVVLSFRGYGDPELQAIDQEAKDSERSAYAAAMKASRLMAVASAVGREVRHTRRQLEAQKRIEGGQRELGAPSTGIPGATATVPPPPPPPPHP